MGDSATPCTPPPRRYRAGMDLSLTAFVLALLGIAAVASSPEDDAADALRVLSANVRYGTAQDGAHAWDRRAEFCLATLVDAKPDVLGLQEALDFQVEAVRGAFPHHAVLGEGRDGGAKGEWCALLVDTRRFDVRACGTFRLAPKDELGAVGWDAALTRIATWAELSDRADGARVFRVVNAHFDHEGKRARVESARRIARWCAAREVMPTVVMGDLNAGEASPPLAAFREAGFRDTLRSMERDVAPVGTFHGFEGGREGEKIDHVLVHGPFDVEEAWIDWTESEGRFPSDHRFVGAALRIRR